MSDALERQRVRMAWKYLRDNHWLSLCVGQQKESLRDLAVGRSAGSNHSTHIIENTCPTCKHRLFREVAGCDELSGYKPKEGAQ